MSIKSRFFAVGALSLALAAGGATAAFAGTTPSPTDSPTQFGVGHHKIVRTTPWQFDLQQSDIGRPPSLNILVNNVESGRTGIIMRNWHDTQLTPNIDRFSRGANSVTLLHESLAAADINVNLRTCSVTLAQDGRFRIINGTGTGAGFRSLNGEFVLQGLVSYPLIRDRFCPLQFVDSHTLLRALLTNLVVGGQQPSFVDVGVQGRAELVRVSPVHIFAPTVSPTGTDTVTPVPANS